MSSEQSEESEESADASSGGGFMGIVRTIVPGFIRGSFAIKFGIALLVIGLSVGAVGFVGSQLVKSEFQDEVNEQFGSLANRDAGSVTTWATSNVEEAKSLSRIPLVERGNPSEIGSWLLNERSDNGNWGENSVIVHYVDVDNGRILNSTDPMDYQGRDLSALNDSVTASLDDISVGGGVQKSNAYIGKNGKVRIAFTAAVDDDVDTTRAIVYTVRPNQFAVGNIGETDLSGVAMVIDEQNRVIMEEYGARDVLLQNYTESAWAQPLTDARALESGDSTTLVSDEKAGGVLSGNLGDKSENYALNGNKYVVGAAPVTDINTNQINQNLPWVVLVHQNTDDAYGEVSSVVNQQLLATFAGVLLIVVFGAVLGRNTANAIDRLKGKAQEMEEGNLEVDLSSGRVDQIGRLYEGFANMRDALKSQIEEAESARKEAEVSRAEAMEMSNYLQEKADEYAEILQQCAAGDLTQRMDVDGENEAMDRIAAEFNEMIDELEKTTGQLKSFADEVETAGDVVQNSSESVRDASEQVADSIQKISDDAYDQKERLQEISATMDEIANDLEGFAAETDVDFGESLDRIEEIATMLSDLTELSEGTMAEAENVAGAAEEQAAELNEVSQRAEDLSRYARPLREVLDRFETESEHEFYFPTGPGSGEATMPDTDDE